VCPHQISKQLVCCKANFVNILPLEEKHSI